MAAERVYDELLCFLGDPIFQVPIRTFMDENCVIFDPSIEISQEHKEVHTKYKKLFDALLESFCRDVKMTSEKVTESIAHLANIPDLREVFSTMFEQCNAATDFTAFCQTMVKRNIMIQEQVLRMIMEATGSLPASLSLSGGIEQPTAADDEHEQELLKQVMQQSKQDADARAKSLQEKDADMLNKTLELSKQEASKLDAERKSIDEQMKRMALEAQSHIQESPGSFTLLPGPASYAPLNSRSSSSSSSSSYHAAASQSSSQPAKASVPGPASYAPASRSSSSSQAKPVVSSIPEPASYAPRHAAAPAAPASRPPAQKPTAATAQKAPPTEAPAPVSFSATSLGKAPVLPAISGTEAANQWLKSAQAEANQSAAHAQVAASLSSLSPEEMKKRQQFLREQRDKLLAMKKQAREKQLGAASSAQPARPQSSRTARTAMNSRGEAAGSAGGGDEEDEKKLQMRRAIADRLKQEVIGK